MIPEFQPMTLLAAGLLILVGFGFTGYLVSKEQALEKRLAKRRDSILRQPVRVQPIDIRSFARAARDQTSLKSRIALWFGVDFERLEICPLPWWIVVGATAVVAEVGISALSTLLGDLAWIAYLPLWIMFSRVSFLWFKSKRQKKLLLQFPDALMMIVRAVRVGVPVGEAVHIIASEQPAPTSEEFKLLASQLAIGEPLDKAVTAMARHADMPEYRFFAIALALQSKAGGALSGTLEGLADMIRKRVGVKERAHALASEARMSIYVLTGLPVLVGAGLTFLNPEYIGLLTSTPTGNKILTAAILTLLTGWGVMQLIVKKSVS